MLDDWLLLLLLIDAFDKRRCLLGVTCVGGLGCDAPGGSVGVGFGGAAAIGITPLPEPVEPAPPPGKLVGVVTVEPPFIEP